MNYIMISKGYNTTIITHSRAQSINHNSISSPLYYKQDGKNQVKSH